MVLAGKGGVELEALKSAAEVGGRCGDHGLVDCGNAGTVAVDC